MLSVMHVTYVERINTRRRLARNSAGNRRKKARNVQPSRKKEGAGDYRNIGKRWIGSRSRAEIAVRRFGKRKEIEKVDAGRKSLSSITECGDNEGEGRREERTRGATLSRVCIARKAGAALQGCRVIRSTSAECGNARSM